MSSARPQPADAAVREQLIHAGRSFIVQAPAGSGKTELLMQRYLNLLADPSVTEPEQVLAITFTRKAAAQMRNRLLDALEKAAEPAPATLAPHQLRTRELAARVLTRDGEQQWQLLRNPSRLQVRTLDSFCDTLVRRAPLQEAFDTASQVTEDAAPLYDEAARQVLVMLGQPDRQRADAVRTLLEHLDNHAGNFQRLVAGMLVRRDQWLELIGGSTHRLSDEELVALRCDWLEPALADSVRYELQLIRAAVAEALPPEVAPQLFAAMQYAAENLKDDEKSPIKALAGIAELPPATPEAVEQWRALNEFFFTQAGTLRKTLNKNNGFPPAGREMRDFCIIQLAELGEAFAEAAGPRLARLKRLPPVTYPEPQWEALRALFQLLPWAVAALKTQFKSAGLVDFSEVAQAARATLVKDGAPSDLSFHLGARIRHVLVDEFQDTSVSQVALLKSLLETWDEQEGCTLFLVGDPMQSIYGWREAEVTLFAETQTSGVGSLRPQAESLTVNFRSQQRLVEWFNSAFPLILNEANVATGAVPYCSAASMVPPTVEPVRIHGFIGRQDAAEANLVVDLIEQALAETAQGTVAVLVRARTHLPEIARSLKRRNVPFRAVKTDPLGGRQAVRDIDALARALWHLADRTAWLAVLRAPWCGLSLCHLAELCEEDRHSPVWELLQRPTARLNPAGQARLARVVPILRDALAARGRVSLRTLVESTWLSLGGLASLPPGSDGEADRRDVEAYLDLLAAVSDAEELPEPARLQSKLDELYAPADTAVGIRVELMTIHTAKGLEFDTVIVPGLGRRQRNDDPQLLYWRQRVVEGRQQLLLGALESAGTGGKDGTVEGYLRQLQKDRAHEEDKRMLYVAATRARRQLHLVGHVRVPNQPSAIAPDSSSLLAILWQVPQVREAFAALPLPEPQAEGSPVAASLKLRRLPLDWVATPPASPFTWSAPQPRGVTDEAHTFDWASDGLRRIGTVTHAFLHRIAREGVDAWDEALLIQRNGNIRAALLAAGIAPDDLDAATDKVATALRNVLRDQRGRWLLQAHPEAQSEFAITAVIDAEMRRLKVDRTFIENGERWIVDYKVADRQGGDRESFLRAQLEKYRADLERYRQALAALDARPARLALYFPLLNEFRELPARSVAAEAAT